MRKFFYGITIIMVFITGCASKTYILWPDPYQQNIQRQIQLQQLETQQRQIETQQRQIETQQRQIETLQPASEFYQYQLKKIKNEN